MPKLKKVIMRKLVDNGIWYITFVDACGKQYYRVISSETAHETCKKNPDLHEAYLRCVNSARNTITLYYGADGKIVARVA